MNAQKEKVIRDLDTNIHKIMDSYRLLLQKGQVSTAGEMSIHEELQVETASTSIVSLTLNRVSFVLSPWLIHKRYFAQVFHARAILDQIHDLRMHLLLQSDAESSTASKDS